MTEQLKGTHSLTKLGPFWDGWIRWDAEWFMRIVKQGYFTDGDPRTKMSNVAFFPLFPYTVRAATKLVGGRNHWIAGLFLSNVATLFGLFYMFRIARRYLDEEAARRSLVYLLLFPSSFFFSSYYSEGLFLLTTAASFYFFLEKRFFLCGVCGYLAALTRNPGVLLFPAFVLSLLWQRRGKLSRADLPGLWLLLIPCGLLTFMATLYLKVGDPLAHIHAHYAWWRKPTLPHETLWEGFRGIWSWSRPTEAYNMVHLIDTLSAVVFLILPFFLLKTFDKSLGIYSLLVILMPLCSGAMYSMMRFELAAFPSFFVLAQLGANRNVDRFIVSASAIFLGLLSLAFTNWYFIG
jgi:Gpi18-like mannosyltransferase